MSGLKNRLNGLFEGYTQCSVQYLIYVKCALNVSFGKVIDNMCLKKSILLKNLALPGCIAP